MSFRSRLESVLDLLGMLGFTVRDSARFKSLQAELAQRQWGPEAAGFALSIKARPAESLVNEPVRLAVALRNSTGADIRRDVEDWLQFFQVDLRDEAGARVEQSGFGRRVLGNHEPLRSALFASDAPVQAELPLSDLYRLDVPGKYRVFVQCVAPSSDPAVKCQSNEAVINRVAT